MESRLPLYWRGTEWGILRCWEQEVRTTFSFRCASPGPGLYKAYLIGEQGSILLGTPMPEGNCLTFGRTLTHPAMKACGAFPPLRGELTLASDGGPVQVPRGWSALREGEVPALDEALSRSFRALPQLWRREEADGFVLAVPWRPGQEIPVPALICFAQMQSLDGRCCLLFAFDHKGRPRLPQERKEGEK